MMLTEFFDVAASARLPQQGITVQVGLSPDNGVVDDFTVSESQGFPDPNTTPDQIAFTIYTRNTPSVYTYAIVVNYEFIDGTARAGIDYQPVDRFGNPAPMSGTVRFTAGVNGVFVFFKMLNDTQVEPEESFSLRISGPATDPPGRAIIAVRSGFDVGTRRIADDDGDCPATISPTSATVGADLIGENHVAVTAPAGCRWTARSNVDWILVPITSGIGNDVVYYEVDDNSGPQRTGTMTIAGRTFSCRECNGSP
ncbi:MAG TPA: Calx-beta domain-containing protein [Blastocatellia bacterium]|nr:Calx-beta domain-containing protein [Blastocatellia bacterium]